MCQAEGGPRRVNRVPISGVQQARIDVGQRLLHFLAAHQQTAEHIAAEVGIPEEHLSLVLTGHADLACATLYQILNVLDVEWQQFFGGEDMPVEQLHHLTLTSNEWQAVEAEFQTFDIRRDTPPFAAGDIILYEEKRGNIATGRRCYRQISHLVYAGRNDGPPGYVLLGLRPFVETHESTIKSQPMTREAPCRRR